MPVHRLAVRARVAASFNERIYGDLIIMWGAFRVILVGERIWRRSAEIVKSIQVLNARDARMIIGSGIGAGGDFRARSRR
eukprot:9094184-Pyramimonas_sp.AAC.1